MSAIGYRECIQVLAGQMDIEEAKVLMRRRTRMFIRRQANWFRLNDPSIHWFDAGEIKVEEIERIIREFLKTDK
jgi:tRNA dimethylallyltransferase